jgi:hypothetical protein
LINTHIDPINLEDSAELEYYPKEKITVYHFPRKNNDRMDTILSRISFSIVQHYTLHVDADEFLYLGNNVTLQCFLIDKQEYNCFRFNWLMAPSSSNCTYVNNSLSDILRDNEDPKYFVKQFKSMAKTNIIKFPSPNPHEFSIIDGNNLNIFTDYNKLFVIHFAYRNRYDAYLKTMCERNLQNFDDFISESIDKINITDIPERVMFYIAECSYSNSNHSIDNIVSADMIQRINMNIKSTTNRDFLFKLIPDMNKYNIFSDRCKKIKNLKLFGSLSLNYMIKGEILKYITRINDDYFIDV